MNRDRAGIQAADGEAERRWPRQQLLAARIEKGGGQLLRRGGLQCRHSQPGPHHSVRVEAD